MVLAQSESRNWLCSRRTQSCTQIPQMNPFSPQHFWKVLGGESALISHSPSSSLKVHFPDLLRNPRPCWAAAGSAPCIPKGGILPWAEPDPTVAVTACLLSAPSPLWVWGEPRRRRALQAPFLCWSKDSSPRQPCVDNRSPSSAGKGT